MLRIFGSKAIDTDEKKIDEILERSVSDILPSKEELKKLLMSGKRLRIYTGADATGADLHLGHSTNFIILNKLRELGHEVIVLFGDFTATIGDPTDKSAARQKLSTEEVVDNIRSWKDQIKPLIPFGGENSARIVKNSRWLSRLSFKDVLELSSNFTVQQMVERDMFDKRMRDGKPIYISEFMYPLMQGYDSVALDVDLEIGGNDQLFNMMAGRTLQDRLKNRNKFVLTTTLLEDPKTGKKLMSKSEGGYVALNDKPQDMFGKVMALPDEAIVQLYTDCTNISFNEIKAINTNLEEGSNPKNEKMNLAYEIVKIYHGEDDAIAAKDNFNKAFSGQGIPEDAPEVSVSKGLELVKVLLDNDLVSSKSDFRRLVEQGGVGVVGGEKIKDPSFKIEESIELRVGKHRFIKINVGP